MFRFYILKFGGVNFKHPQTLRSKIQIMKHYGAKF